MASRRSGATAATPSPRPQRRAVATRPLRARVAAAGPWAALIVVLSLVVGLVIYTPRLLDHWPIERVQVKGVTTAERQQQVSASLAGLVAGKNFFTVSLGDLRDRAERLDWVAKAEVTRQWPDSIKLQVTERVPVAVWNGKQLVSNKGVVFAAVDDYDTRDLPKLYGHLRDVSQVMSYYHSISQALAGLDLGIKSLRVDARLTARIVLSNNMLVVVDRHDFAFKLRRFVRLYRKVLNRDGHSVARADLRYANGVAVKYGKRDKAAHNSA